jgi:uncharacterized membrane protein
MNQVRRTLGTAVLVALAALGAGVMTAPAASAGVGGMHHYAYDDVVAARTALGVADVGCDIATVPVPPWIGMVACGHGLGEVRDGLDEAFYRHCGMDLYWSVDGPKSYDGTYRVVVCP